jgi:biofilm PGA synthesis lipoprotein PgaB
LWHYNQGSKQLAKPGFLISFDDGYKDVLSTKDYFQSLGIKPIVFALAEPQKANRAELKTNRQFLNFDDLKELKLAGWEIGCHSATHPDFSKLTPVEIQKEIIDSKKLLESVLGFEVKYFAYPKGVYNEEILAAAQLAGYSLAFSMDDGWASPKGNPLAVPRVGVDRTHSFLEFKTLYAPSVIATKKIFRKIIPGGIL